MCREPQGATIGGQFHWRFLIIEQKTSQNCYRKKRSSSIYPPVLVLHCLRVTPGGCNSSASLDCSYGLSRLLWYHRKLWDGKIEMQHELMV